MLEEMFEGNRKYVVFGAAVLLVALVAVGATASSSSPGAIPSPVPGIGERVAVLKVSVSGRWTHYTLFLEDSVTIDSVDWSVDRWMWSLAVYPVRLSSADKDDAKIVWELWDSSNNKVGSGEVQFKLMEAWKVTFTTNAVKPGTYNLRVTVYQWVEQGIWPFQDKRWVERDSEAVSITLNPPST